MESIFIKVLDEHREYKEIHETKISKNEIPNILKYKFIPIKINNKLLVYKVKTITYNLEGNVIVIVAGRR